jgi:O-acetyl-ADP-ribose deacetylase (regulator of RNase III)
VVHLPIKRTYLLIGLHLKYRSRYHSLVIKKPVITFIFTNKKMWNHNSIVKLIQESQNPDPINEIRERARKLVLKAFDLGWEGPPFNIMQLANILGIDIIPNDEVIDARIVPLKKGHLQIQYNPFQKPTRINFSIAHEIGHTLFSDCEEDIRNREVNFNTDRQLERLCNIAASEIQLPYAVFSNDANNSPLTIEGLLELAKKYNASLESVFLRYAEVVDKPCAILFGILKKEDELFIDYSITSKLFNYIIPNDLIVPKNSKVLECIAPGWTSRELITWEILNNEEHIAYAIGISPYKRDNKHRVAILIVPNSLKQDELESNKISLEYGDATKPRGNDVKIIAQVVNTTAATGLGFGKSLAKNYPVIKVELDKWSKDKLEFKLGESNLVKINDYLYVFQMLAQKGLFPKDNEIPLKYNALRKCLNSLASEAKNLGASVHMPQIGAGQARGDWNIILGMIHDELIRCDIKVNIYILPGKAYNPKNRSVLTVFKETSTWETGKLF